MHTDMRVRDALRASAAIPFYFSPLRSPFDEGDLLLDGCLTDCEFKVTVGLRTALLL